MLTAWKLSGGRPQADPGRVCTGWRVTHLMRQQNTAGVRLGERARATSQDKYMALVRLVKVTRQSELASPT